MVATFHLRNQLDAEFIDESDRGCAILTMCLLEEELAHLFGALLPGGIKDATQLMPRGRLSMGISNAERLGLIDSSIADNLRLLGKIRNTFAHGIMKDLSFESDEIRQKVDQLLLPNLESVPDVRGEVESNPRQRYMMAFDNMFFTLNEIKNNVDRLPRLPMPTLSISRVPNSGVEK